MVRHDGAGMVGQSPKPTSGAYGRANAAFEPCSGAVSRACLFGLPGAGKSTCIKWLRDFFENCLQWVDGVQFQFLAAQNTMAALIGGKTIHPWSKIPVNATDGG